MEPLSVSIEIDVPREAAFAAIADLSRRPAFTDHFLADFRLTRIDPRGVGAGARFRVEMPLRSVWMDSSIVEIEQPHKLVERGAGGRLNRIPTATVWELTPGNGSLTRVTVSHWSEPDKHVDRTLETLSGASHWQQRGWREALRRLRDLLESEAKAPAALAVAGGNAHATGIP